MCRLGRGRSGCRAQSTCLISWITNCSSAADMGGFKRSPQPRLEQIRRRCSGALPPQVAIQVEKSSLSRPSALGPPGGASYRKRGDSSLEGGRNQKLATRSGAARTTSNPSLERVPTTNPRWDEILLYRASPATQHSRPIAPSPVIDRHGHRGRIRLRGEPNQVPARPQRNIQVRRHRSGWFGIP